MAYRAPLEITAEEDLFSADSLAFLANKVQYGEEEYDLSVYYDFMKDLFGKSHPEYEVTSKHIYITTHSEDPDPYILFKVLIFKLQPKKTLELRVYADPDKSTNEDFGLPEEYSLPYYKLRFDGSGFDYDDPDMIEYDSIGDEIEGCLDGDGAFVINEDGDEVSVWDVTDDWTEIMEWQA